MANKTSFDQPTKRRRTSTSPTSRDWSELHIDLLESILKRLSFSDILRFRAVCHSWRSLAKSYISSLFNQPLIDQPPCLMLPLDQPQTPNLYSEEEVNNGGRCFFNLAEKQAFKLKNTPKDFQDSLCVGSSHGFLILFNKKQKLRPYMFNPFLGLKIQLPIGFSFQSITKAVLSSNPICKNNYGVIVIYGSLSKLAFTKCGDTKWTNLEGSNQYYIDVICCEDHIYALSELGSVEIWDFLNVSIPLKKRTIDTDCPERKLEIEGSNRDLYSSQFYLVESLGDLLLVVRYIGNFVREDGELVYESDLLGDEESPHLVCPYMTKMFYVYKLDFDQKRWVGVESLGDRVLFLGGNHSVSLSSQSVPCCRGNSIYFTDDCWERMDEHDMYGGHDMGVFGLEDSFIHFMCQSELKRFEPAPFWVVRS